MTPDRWAELEALFAAALEQPLDQRVSFASARAPDADSLADVLALLRAHDARGRLDSIADGLRRPRRTDTIPVAELVGRLGAGLAERYRIERELGRGGMAIVLLARDLKHGRDVALKVLHPDLALSIGPARFLREIAIAARLTHPHILPLHDSGEAAGFLYYVMPYVEGESLRDRLRRDTRLPVEEAVQIARQVAGALHYAHSRDVVHRDIKPENILLEAGQAVVSDFGIARAMTAAGGDELSETGIVLGTPAYMSPEQAVGVQGVDGRTDLYSLACVLYEMLAGTPPFTQPTIEGMLQQHLSTSPPSVRDARPDVPEAVDDAIRRALAKAPVRRYLNASAFADALPQPGAGAAGRWRFLAWAAGAVAVAALGTATLLAGRRSAVDPAASVIAVLPLVPTVPDTDLARLGRDLVLTLSANLDGVRRIRTVDALTVLAQTRQSGPLALQPGIRLAGLLGAASVVHGAIVRAGSRVRIDVGLFRTDNGQPVGRASVTADPQDLATLTDSLTGTLLRDVWRTGAPPTPSLESLTTRSLPALQAFLEGEHALLESRWQDAAEAYGRAIAADSTFWLAYWRFVYAREWYLNLGDTTIIAAIKAHRDALPARDRLVFESWLTDSIVLALARGREVSSRYPDYWPGWMVYGDWLFHAGPVYGHDLTEAQAALERTVALNPDFTAAWEHLLWVSLARDTATAARALAALDRLNFRRSLIAEFGFDVTRVYRLQLALERAGSIDRPLLDSIAWDLIHVARGRVGSGADLPRAQVEISRRVLRGNPKPPLAAVHERLLADAWASRGAWDSALVVAERFARRVPGGEPLQAYRLAVIGAWLGALEPGTAARHRVSPTGSSAAELAWLDGLLAATRRDRNALAAARARLRHADTLSTPILDRSLAAFDAELAGSRAQAARDLAALNWDQPDVLAPAYAEHPYVIAISRLAAARWLREEGDGPGATRAAMWFDAAWALDGYRTPRRVLMGLGALERARIAGTLGDSAAARRSYEVFLRRYDTPVPAHHAMVEEARTALARLNR